MPLISFLHRRFVCADKKKIKETFEFCQPGVHNKLFFALVRIGSAL